MPLTFVVVLLLASSMQSYGAPCAETAPSHDSMTHYQCRTNGGPCQQCGGGLQCVPDIGRYDSESECVADTQCIAVPPPVRKYQCLNGEVCQPCGGSDGPCVPDIGRFDTAPECVAGSACTKTSPFDTGSSSNDAASTRKYQCQNGEVCQPCGGSDGPCVPDISRFDSAPECVAGSTCCKTSPFDSASCGTNPAASTRKYQCQNGEICQPCGGSDGPCVPDIGRFDTAPECVAGSQCCKTSPFDSANC